ncbi:MAG TPA: hypothetical protein VGL29_16900 [Blastocatellia bacterium]|jgi:hypothetical protein
MVKRFLQSLLKALCIPFTATFWTHLVAGLREICHAIGAIFSALRGGRVPTPRARDRTGCCIDLPPEIYKRADPLIYAQYYLMSQGLAVTWDNPDITVLDGTTPVTGPLKPAYRYTIRVRIWNGSYDAPAVGVGVELSYLSFGIQTVSHPIGMGSVNLGVKGSADCPAFLELDWETPAVGGHYCIQARLLWFDDANPDNNFGQKNVAVAPLLSPARFSFQLRNQASVARRFLLEADSYGLPELSECNEEQFDRSQTRLRESRARWELARRTQGYGQFPVPRDWTLEMRPQSFGLQAGEEQEIEVAIEPINSSFRGRKTFNVHAFAMAERDQRHFAGGVTLTVTNE